MKKILLEKIELHNYRNFAHLSLDFSSGPVLIIGPNGRGKTNILEAISLLSPGRGLRGVNFEEICRDGSDSWQMRVLATALPGRAEISMLRVPGAGSRRIEYNGSKITSSELPNFFGVIWLTPQNEDVFCTGTSNRRRFFDRVVYSFDSLHAKRIVHYEHCMRERLRTLVDNNYGAVPQDTLNFLEENMARTGAEIENSRREVLAILQETVNANDTAFPKAIFELDSSISRDIESENIIDYYKKNLYETRVKDSHAGRTSFGVHRSDFSVFRSGDGRSAKLCSTGEQKAFLISIIISQVSALSKEKGSTPIVLLDELFVHLDELRSDYLTEYIINSGAQVFITATDVKRIENLAQAAQVIEL